MGQTAPPPNILEVLDGITFPVTLVELVAYAGDQDASEDVMDLIQAMPDLTYRNMRDISLHLGQIENLPAPENIWSSEPAPEWEDRPGDDDLGPMAGFTTRDRIA